MITLKEALKLCQVHDEYDVFLYEKVGDGDEYPCYQRITCGEVKNHYDLERTVVTAITPYFCCGEYEGFSFCIEKKEDK